MAKYVVRQALVMGNPERPLDLRRRGMALDGTTFYQFFRALWPDCHMDPEKDRDSYVPHAEAAKQFRAFRSSQVTLKQWAKQEGR